MTERIDFLVLYIPALTTRASHNSTDFASCGNKRSPFTVNMSFCGVFCLYGIGFIATTALCGFRSVSQASCVIIIYVVRKIVSECLYFFLLYKHFVAAGTMFPLGFSGGCACCFDCFVGNFCVTECRSLFILYGSAFIARASHNPFGFARSDRKRSPVAPLVFARAGGKREQRRQYKRAQSNG